ncbi:MAG: hypothetical protein JWP05_906 [Microbacteriaceae bacterium]|nr:hypothetical protein [Microbacteriaceae bacterium]
MADETLRLPNTIFRAVFDLGDKRAANIVLPAALSEPELFAEWLEDEHVVALYVEFEHGQLHVDCSSSGIEHHFHDRVGESSQTSPWPSVETEVLIEWASMLASEVFARMPNLMEDIEEAAAWYEAGYPLYVCETDPAFLDLLEVEIEGEILTLPWLGSGQVGQEHLDGDNHPVALLWNPVNEKPDRAIATAWLDPATGEPATAAEPGVDWDDVGLPADEVLVWLEGTYLNNHISPDPESAIIQAVLRRMGGLDGE